MTIKLSIIGLGQIGASIGLALESHKDKLHRVGNDKSLLVARAAHKRGAVDEIKINLPATVRDARILVLSLPLNEIYDTLQSIAPDLGEEILIMDTAPAKEQVATWMQKILPEHRYYVGLTPAINPNYLLRAKQGVEAATPDLFQDGVMMLNPLPDTPEEAIRLAADFARLLGATPLFSDALETDGVMASAHLLPQLVAAATLNATIDQPGWQDARKLAGRPYAALAAALAYQDEIKSLGEAAMVNHENVVRALDLVIASLQGMRDDIVNGDRKKAEGRLKSAAESHDRWLGERLAANWAEVKQADLFDVPSFWERYMGTRSRSSRKK